MKNKSTLFFIFILLCLTFVLGYNYFYRPIYKKLATRIEKKIATVVTPIPEPTVIPEQTLIEKLSYRQRVAQLIAVPITFTREDDEGTQLSKALDWLSISQPGLVTIFGEEVENGTAKDKIEQIMAVYADASLLPLIAVDHEGGLVQRLSGSGFSKLPAWKSICVMEDKEVLQIYRQSATELAEVGVNIVFAPVVDLANNNRVLKTRACADEAIVAQKAKLYVSQFGQQGIMPVLKHFPGIGKVKKDLHQYYDTVELEAEDARVFDRILTDYPNLGVMTAHVAVKDQFDGQVCSLSASCLQAFPSQYPEVILFTDALDMKSALNSPMIDSEIDNQHNQQLKTFSQVSKEALLAGNDVLVFGKGVTLEELSQVLDDLVAEYENNEEFQQTVDKSLLRVIILKTRGAASVF